jgi:hypothetical protein
VCLSTCDRGLEDTAHSDPEIRPWKDIAKGLSLRRCIYYLRSVDEDPAQRLPANVTRDYQLIQKCFFL